MAPVNRDVVMQGDMIFMIYSQWKTYPAMAYFLPITVLASFVFVLLVCGCKRKKGVQKKVNGKSAASDPGTTTGKKKGGPYIYVGEKSSFAAKDSGLGEQQPKVYAGVGKLPGKTGDMGKVQKNAAGVGKLPGKTGDMGKVQKNAAGVGNLPGKTGAVGNVQQNAAGVGKLPGKTGAVGKVQQNAAGVGKLPKKTGAMGE